MRERPARPSKIEPAERSKKRFCATLGISLRNFFRGIADTEVKSLWLLDSYLPRISGPCGTIVVKFRPVSDLRPPPSPQRQTLLRMSLECPKIGVQKFSKFLKTRLCPV